MRKTGIIYLFSAAIVALSSCSHSHSHEEAEKEDAHASEHKHGADVIIFEPEQAEAAGITVETVAPGPFSGVLKTSGKVLSASGDETSVVSTVAGVVSLNRQVSEGMPVGAGTPLFTVVSSGLEQGDVSRRAEIAYEAAKREYERAEKLVADKIITEKEFTAAKSDFENARLAYEAVGKSSGSKGIQIKSPKGGFVKECLVKEGDFVNVGQPLMVVTQNRNLYLRAEVAERDYPQISHITSARFKTAYDDKVYKLEDLGGRLVSRGKTPGTESTFIPVTFEFANRGSVLPGSFAEIYLITGERENVISVPVEALTEEQGVFYVYVKEDEECYRKQEVKLGESDGIRREVISGLKGGETLVSSGAIHVKLASMGKSIPGHTHNH